MLSAKGNLADVTGKAGAQNIVACTIGKMLGLCIEASQCARLELNRRTECFRHGEQRLSLEKRPDRCLFHREDSSDRPSRLPSPCVSSLPLGFVGC